jgi:hypothetical protein
MTRDTQHVELAQQHRIQTKGQHFGLTQVSSRGFVSHFKFDRFCARVGEVQDLSLGKVYGAVHD